MRLIHLNRMVSDLLLFVGYNSKLHTLDNITFDHNLGYSCAHFIIIERVVFSETDSCEWMMSNCDRPSTDQETTLKFWLTLAYLYNYAFFLGGLPQINVANTIEYETTSARDKENVIGCIQFHVWNRFLSS